MRIVVAVAIGLLVLSGGAYLARGQAEPAAESPQAVYAECQALQAELEGVEGEIKGIEFEITDLQAARRNYEYVNAQNAKKIERLARAGDA